MSDLIFEVKKRELNAAFKEQKQSGRVCFDIPFPEDENEREKVDKLYAPYVKAHLHRGELGWGFVVINNKEEEMRYKVRIIAAFEKEDRYQVDVRFADKDLFT